MYVISGLQITRFSSFPFFCSGLDNYQQCFFCFHREHIHTKFSNICKHEHSYYHRRKCWKRSLHNVVNQDTPSWPTIDKKLDCEGLKRGGFRKYRTSIARATFFQTSKIITEGFQNHRIKKWFWQGRISVIFLALHFKKVRKIFRFYWQDPKLEEIGSISNSVPFFNFFFSIWSISIADTADRWSH